MKDTEKSRPTKKKILLYYLILAACILIIAAITVAVVFSVRNNNEKNLTIDNEQQQPEEPDESGNQGDGNQNDDDDDEGENQTPNTPTTTTAVFLSPIANVDVTQKQDLWYDQTLKMYYLHRGVDFSAEAGTEVLAALDGTVTEILTDDAFYGGVITLTHDNGIKTVYRFIDPLENLSVGDKVSRGDVIATVAVATGVENLEGAHLHFEVYENNVLTDPEDFIGTEK